VTTTNDFDRLRAKALEQIADATGGSTEYVTWFRAKSPAARQAADLLKLPTLDQFASIPREVFCARMALVVAFHFLVFSTWNYRDELPDRVTSSLFN
jgi:hypothetical protein